jgi:hypothetical protein
VPLEPNLKAATVPLDKLLAFKLVSDAPDPLKVVAVTVPVLETVNLAVPFWSPVLIRKLDESLFKVHAGDPPPTIKLELKVAEDPLILFIVKVLAPGLYEKAVAVVLILGV